MTVLDRGELQASPLADLHLIADQMGLEGFRRLRKADLIDAILGERRGDDGGDRGGDDGEGRAGDDGEARSGAPSARRTRSRRPRLGRPARAGGATAPQDPVRDEEPREAASDSRRAPAREQRGRPDAEERMAEGIVEVVGNGSAFLRVQGSEPSDDDVYISVAQVRRCELVTGDRVAGPARSPRRSERYPSLIRIETINGAPAESVSQGTRYDDLPSAWPDERIELRSEDPTLQAIESSTPLGLGSRAVIAGPARSGKTETLRRIRDALAGREGLDVMPVLCGVRPEEIADWAAPCAPLAALSFAASPDAQGQAVEGVVENAKRIAARGGNVVVLIDSLDGMHPHTARRVLAAARNLSDGGSLTVIATATRPFGGETTVIALDASQAGAGRPPVLDQAGSGTLKAELLAG